MKEENVIEVKNITKKFKVYLDKGYTLKELALFSKRRKYEERNVLDGISFEVKKGEAIGLIGRNGCGKSTTLKLLTKIMYPDSGTIEMRGRVSSLIELGAGFHPDMSGRQNIYTNAAIFGLTKAEIDRRLDDIIAFSELEEFIDNPVRTYSSGMYMRLAFSVAISVDADILLIDEILGVGDQAFQQKCFDKLKEIKAQGTSIVIVSHALGQIEEICSRSLWIHEGKIIAEGSPREIHPQYLDFMGEHREQMVEKEMERQRQKEVLEQENKVEIIEEMIDTESEQKATEESKLEKNKERWGNGKARISDIRFLDNRGVEKAVYKTGDFMSIIVSYNVNKRVEDAILGIGIFSSDGIRCYGTNTKIDKLGTINLTKNGKYVVNIEKLNLMPGEYVLDVAIEAGISEPIDYFTRAKTFKVLSDMQDIGICRLDHKWNISECR